MKRLLFGLLCTLFSLQSFADALAGQEKAAMCAGCHGPQGISINPAWPNLAGQHVSYLAKQLQEYKEAKTRNAAIMTPMVMQLSLEDMKDIAEFYAHLPHAQNDVSEKYLTRGEAIYQRGDQAKHITACIACHGPKGTGNAQAGFPLLAGQQPVYTIQQLQAFKDKTRSNDLNSIMRDISTRMSQDDMEAVAYYLAGLK